MSARTAARKTTVTCWGCTKWLDNDDWFILWLVTVTIMFGYIMGWLLVDMPHHAENPTSSFGAGSIFLGPPQAQRPLTSYWHHMTWRLIAVIASIRFTILMVPRLFHHSIWIFICFSLTSHCDCITLNCLLAPHVVFINWPPLADPKYPALQDGKIAMQWLDAIVVLYHILKYDYFESSFEWCVYAHSNYITTISRKCYSKWEIRSS